MHLTYAKASFTTLKEMLFKRIHASCGNSSSCLPDNTYSGHSGAFHCLVEGIGDIAFLKADTTLLYSLEGMNNQSWSTKSISDFM